MNEDLVERARIVWFLSGGQDQPSSVDSGVEVHDGKTYVVLRNCRGILKVYRVLASGGLKGLLRYPAGLETNYALRQSEQD